MTIPYTIHPARLQDREAIISLLTAVNLPTEDLPPTLPAFLIAEENGVVVGSVGLELYGEYALLRSLAVAPDKQGTGLGKALYQQAMHLAVRSGAREVFLITTTAASFFTSQGFAQTDRASVPIAIQRTAQFSSICPSSATVMHRKMD